MKKYKNQGIAYSRAKQQEKEVARKLGGMKTPRSGAGDVKGDVKVDRVARLELKTTTKKSFSVTLDMIDKIENAVGLSDEIPCIEVEFIDARGRKIKSVRILPEWAVDILIGRCIDVTT